MRITRLSAFAIDYVLIIAWAGALFAIVMLSGGPPDAVDTSADKLRGWALAFVTLTLPIILASAAFEAIISATPGKRIMRLRVETGSGGPPHLPRTVLRNLVKYAPWELAHIGIWLMPGRPFIDPPTTLNLAIWTTAMALAALNAGLTLATGRGIHDRIAGTVVKRRTETA